jgi:hypothetical protein
MVNKTLKKSFKTNKRKRSNKSEKFVEKSIESKEVHKYKPLR